METQSVSRVANSTGNMDENVLLPVQLVPCNEQFVTTMYDTASTVSLILHKKAEKLGLKGIPVTLTIKGVGNIPQTAHTKQYVVPLYDKRGNTRFVQAFGMDEITEVIKLIDRKKIVEIFHIEDLCRPNGEVELLIGIDACFLFPTVINTVGNLQLLENVFIWRKNVRILFWVNKREQNGHAS